MSFPLVEIDFPEVEPNPDSPDSVREAIIALARFRVRRVFIDVKTITTSYTMNASEDRVLLVDANGGAVTITLPEAVNADAVPYHVKAIDVSGGNVTVDGAGAETIDGAATQVLSIQWQSIELVSDGSNWFIL